MTNPKGEAPGGKLLKFPKKVELSPLEAGAREERMVIQKGFRERGLRLLQLWEDYWRNPKKVETPEAWERLALDLERDTNWLVLIAHCEQWLEAAPNYMVALNTYQTALENAKLFIEQLGQYDPTLATKIRLTIEDFRRG